MIRNSWNVGKIPRMRKQCVPGLLFRGRPGNKARTRLAITELCPHEPRPLLRYWRCFLLESVVRYAAFIRYSEFGGYPLFGSRKCIASIGIAVGTSTAVRYSEEVRYSREGPISEVPLYSLDRTSSGVACLFHARGRNSQVNLVTTTRPLCNYSCSPIRLQNVSITRGDVMVNR